MYCTQEYLSDYTKNSHFCQQKTKILANLCILFQEIPKFANKKLLLTTLKI